MNLELGKIYIRRLRASTRGTDALAARIQIERLLAQTALYPAGLPPSAILFIRRQRGALPRVIGSRDSARLPQLWQQAVRESLDKMIGQAHRPALGAVPPDAEAVIFKDRGEMLSCLASDWRDGSLTARWWWKSVFKTTDAALSVVREWLDSIEHAPAALELLARQGRAEGFVIRLNYADARAILDSMLHRFALVELKAAFSSIFDTEGTGEVETGESYQFKSTSVELSPTTGLKPSAPWDRWVQEVEKGMSLSQLAMLVTGLMLVRAPEVLRSTQFADQFILWHRATNETSTSKQSYIDLPDKTLRSRTRHAPSSARSEGNEIGLSAKESSEAIPAKRDISGENRQGIDDHRSRPHIESMSGIDQLTDANGAAECDESSIPTEADGLLNILHDGLQNDDLCDDDTARLYDLADDVREEPAKIEPLIEAEIETPLGGIFYLINLGLFLNLYNDFTSPALRGIPLPIWDFLAIAGRYLLGKRIEADTVWPLLAQLAGREMEEEPGREFSPPDEWRIPVEWLAPFSRRSVWIADLSNGRLRIRHPEGFFVIDIPMTEVEGRESRVESQIEREMESYRQVAQFEIKYDLLQIESVEASPLERWLGSLMPYALARLKRALRVSEDGAMRKLLFERRARALLSSARLDLFYSLDELPIEIRLSGLDRDPGWVPAAGRYIAFHFE